MAKESDGSFMLSIMEGLIANIQKIDPKTGKNQFLLRSGNEDR